VLRSLYRRLSRPARLSVVLAVLVLPFIGSGPVDALQQDDAEAEVEREKERIRRRKELKKNFTATERIAADKIERFALQAIRSWEDALADVLQEKKEDLFIPLQYYLLDDDWEVVAFACTVVGQADVRELLPDLEEAYDNAAYSIIRRKALEAAALFGKRKVAEARGLLRKGSKDEEPGVRLPAADGLEGLGDDQAKDDLRTLVDDPDPDVRYRSRTALARLGDAAAQKNLIDEFRSYVSTRDQQRRASLVKNDVGERYAQFLNALALGGWGDLEAIKLLGRALLRKDEYRYKLFLSIGAAAALGQARPKEPAAREEQYKLLRLALAERDTTIRGMAALAVGFTRDPKYVKSLAQLLGDAQLDVRHNAVEALGRIPANESISLLSSMLRRERDVAIRLAALRVTTGPRS
jgi:HEAT repeat protein